MENEIIPKVTYISDILPSYLATEQYASSTSITH